MGCARWARPGFAAAAVLTLGLGIGANFAVFSIINEMLLRPLPVADPSSLVRVEAVNPEGRVQGNTSFPNYQDLAEADFVFSGWIASNIRPVSMRHGDTSERRFAEIVSGNYFSVIGVPAALGRTISTDDDRRNSAPVAVIAHHLWWQRFGSDPQILGKTVHLNGNAYSVVGVAPKAFTSATFAGTAIDFWVPLQKAWRWIGPNALTNRDAPGLRVTARLEKGVSLVRAQAAVDAIATRLEAAYPDTNLGEGFRVSPARVLNGSARTTIASILAIAMGFVALVLLTAGANFVNVLLARAVTRRRESAVRMALGAGPARLVRQHLAESASLAVLVGSAGLLFGLWMTGVLARFNPMPDSLAMRFDFAPDARVFIFIVALSVVTGVALGVLPGLQAAGRDVVSVLRAESTGTTGSRTGTRLRSALVIAQVALSAVLLMGAGLFLRSLESLRATDIGFSPDGAFAIDVDATSAALSEESADTFFRELAQRLELEPGIGSVSFTNRLPLSLRGLSAGVHIEGYEPSPGESSLKVSFNRVDLRYFETLGIALIAGRAFSDRDRPNHAGVVIVDETMAQRFWPGVDPLGKLVRLADEAENRELAGRNMSSDTLRVIGVAGNVKYRTVGEEAEPHMYVPFGQRHDGLVPARTLVIRSNGGSAALSRRVQTEVAALNSQVQVFPPRTLEEHAALSLLPSRLAANLSAAFGTIALLLSTIGLYGVVAFWVAQRAPEIGVKIALGARARDIWRLVLGRGFTLIGAGLAVGVAVALGLGRFVGNGLHGVSPTDPVSLVGASAVLLVVALLACVAPARRATRVDPIRILRSE